MARLDIGPYPLHGMRSLAVSRWLEMGCLPARAAGYIRMSLQMGAHYSKGRDHKKLVTIAMNKWTK